jgi:hypothetical protein
MTETERQMTAAVRAANGGMGRAGQWRWKITGPLGTVIINARTRWPHRALRRKIRDTTGVTLPAHPDGSPPP